MNKTAIAILISAACALGYLARDVAHTAPAQAEPQPVAVAEPEKVENSTFDSVVWVKEEEAKASGKPVLYLATLSKNCAPCKRLKGFLDNPISAEAMNRFACVLVEDPPSNHPWVNHYRNHATRSGSSLKFPFIVVEGKGLSPFLQVGAPPDVPGLLHFLQSMEDRFSGKPAPVVVPDSTKTSITYPPKPTLAPASHDTAAPFPTKGRSSGKQERSCVTCQAARGKCFRSGPGIIGQWTFRPGRGGRR